MLEIIVVDSGSPATTATRIRALVSALPRARLERLEQPGLCLARNRGAAVARGEYIAYMDDDTVPRADWAESILRAIDDAGHPALISGRIVPLWEAPLPRWWPARLRGVLSIVEVEGRGIYGSADLPSTLEPCGANLIVHRPALQSVGGFWAKGRCAGNLLADDEVQLLCRLQRTGLSGWYDSRIVVGHQIQAGRMTPGWLLARLYWQGISTVISRRLLDTPRAVWREFPRRLAVAVVLAPCWLIPARSGALIAVRWRAAYAAGFIRAAFRWRLSELV